MSYRYLFHSPLQRIIVAEKLKKVDKMSIVKKYYDENFNDLFWVKAMKAFGGKCSHKHTKTLGSLPC